jgi:hypothetical protein
MDDPAEVTGRGESHRARRRTGRIRERQDDDQPVLRGHQNIPITKSIQNDSLEGGGCGRDRGKRLAGLGQSDLVGARQVEAEWFCPLHELAQVCVTAKQVIDELAPQGLLPPYQLAPGFGMAVREGCHRVVNDLQHRLGGGSHRLVVAFADDRRKLGPYPSRC